MLSWNAENCVHDLHMKDVCVLESVNERLRSGYSQMFRRTGFGASVKTNSCTRKVQDRVFTSRPVSFVLFSSRRPCYHSG